MQQELTGAEAGDRTAGSATPADPRLIAKLAGVLLAFGFLAQVATMAVGFRFLSVEADESWMLMSALKAFGMSVTPSGALDVPVLTNGGVYVVLHGMLAWLTHDIDVHRLISLALAVFCTGFVFFIVKARTQDKKLAFAGAAIFTTVPGFLLQTSMATAELMATSLVLVAMAWFVRENGRSLPALLGIGVLLGLACSTRLTCLALLPALVIWALVVSENRLASLGRAIVVVSVAMLVFTLCVQAYAHAFSQSSWLNFTPGLSGATGVGSGFKGVMSVLNYLTILDSAVPILGMLLLLVLYISVRKSITATPMLRYGSLLLIAGLLGCVAWVMNSPIAHVRYLWPSIALLWLAAILLAASFLVGPKGGPRASTAFVLVAATLCIFQALLNLRVLAVGETMTLTYEFNRVARIEAPTTNFSARRQQEEMAVALRKLPADATIFAINATAAYPIVYLSNRTVRPFPVEPRPAANDYLLQLPANKRIWRPSLTELVWMRQHTEVVARSGNHVLYRLTPGAVLPARRMMSDSTDPRRKSVEEWD